MHSYYAPLGEHSAGVSRYEGTAFTSLLVRGNVVAPQFHPEKSSRAGLSFLRAVRAYFEDATASRSSGLTR